MPISLVNDTAYSPNQAFDYETIEAIMTGTIADQGTMPVSDGGNEFAVFKDQESATAAGQQGAINNTFADGDTVYAILLGLTEDEETEEVTVVTIGIGHVDNVIFSAEEE